MQGEKDCHSDKVRRMRSTRIAKKNKIKVNTPPIFNESYWVIKNCIRSTCIWEEKLHA